MKARGYLAAVLCAVFCVSVFAAFPIVAKAEEVSQDGIVFDTDSGTITGYTGNASTLDIPSAINGVSVETIDGWAFDSCESLMYVSIPSSVKSIGREAFFGCSKLLSVSISSGVTGIGFNVFNYCSALQAINVSLSNSSYKSIDGVLFTKDGQTLIQYPAGKTNAAYTIPSGVTCIGEYSFENCKSLQSVSIQNTVTCIDDYAFFDCGLLGVNIPASVTQLGEAPFNSCTSLAAINVSESNSSYKSVNGVLFTKDGKKLIQYPSAKTDEVYSVPSGVVTVGDYAFSVCGLISVQMPNGVEYIGDNAFEWDDQLVNVTIQSSVNGMGDNVFMGCDKVIISGNEGSYAQTYAEANSIPFAPIIKYRTHVQNIGWQDWKYTFESAGTSGQSLRLEGIYIDIQGWDNSIEYQTHVQNIGWQDWVGEGQMSGTTGQSLRLEAIRIRLKGEAAQQFDIYYRVHAQNIGWMDWAINGQSAGTAGLSYRLEALQIVLVEKDADAPGSTEAPFVDGNSNEQTGEDVSVKYQTHVQNIGWQGWKSDGETAGTSGQSLRLEGIYIDIDGWDDSIEYQTHVQNIGWQSWVGQGEMSGTSGKSLRLEAIRIRLKGEAAQQYDIYYRVHAQNIGWMDWAINGQSAGTAGLSYRLEAIQIMLVEKGGSAPGSTKTPFVSA